MKRLLLCFFIVFWLLPNVTQAQNDDIQKDINAIQKTLMDQQKAWNSGDIASFMKAYAKSDSISFVSSSGINYGWNTIMKNYIKSYPNTSTMGKLSFEIEKISPLGQEYFLVLGKYTLFREFDQPDGYFSLVWHKIDGDWKIINDHTSSSVKVN